MSWKFSPLVVLFVWLVSSSPVVAQTVINPTTVSFTPSPDHSVMVNVPGGSPVPALDHYDMNVLIGSATGVLSWTQGLGKPTPNTQNRIDVVVPRFATLSRGSYVVTVSAVAPGVNGPTSTSVPTDPFVSTGIPAVVPGKPSVQ